jgi:hypothetical protein
MQQVATIALFCGLTFLRRQSAQAIEEMHTRHSAEEASMVSIFVARFARSPDALAARRHIERPGAGSLYESQ